MNIKVAIIALYIAELNGIETAIARLQSNQGKKMVVVSDCQAAIQAVQNPKRSSDQYVVASIYDHIRALQQQPHSIRHADVRLGSRRNPLDPCTRGCAWQ